MNAREAIEAIRIEGIEINGKLRRVTEFFQGLVVAEEALEKRDAKKVLTNNENIPICPSCKAKQSGDTYCGKCGQKLKWW